MGGGRVQVQVQPNSSSSSSSSTSTRTRTAQREGLSAALARARRLFNSAKTGSLASSAKIKLWSSVPPDASALIGWPVVTPGGCRERWHNQWRLGDGRCMQPPHDVDDN